MTPLKLALLMLTPWVPKLALADAITCNFASECIDEEACSQTDYQVTIEHKAFDNIIDAVDYTAQWIDPAVTRQTIIRSRPDIGFAMWAEKDARQFGHLFWTADGTAKYVYMDSEIPMMIAYHGTCRGLS